MMEFRLNRWDMMKFRLLQGTMVFLTRDRTVPSKVLYW